MGHWPLDEEIYEVSEDTGLFGGGYRLIWLYPGPFAKFSGVDMGGKMTAVEGGFDDGPVIIKIAGHTGWEGRGTTSYYPPKYLIGIIKGIDDHGSNGTFHQKHTIVYTRKYTKEARSKAYELYE